MTTRNPFAELAAEYAEILRLFAAQGLEPSRAELEQLDVTYRRRAEEYDRRNGWKHG